MLDIVPALDIIYISDIADIASLVRSSALVTSTTSPDNPLLPVTAQVEHCRTARRC